MKNSAPKELPGDLSRDELTARMIRVDHAGEYGAKRIYEGQLAVLGHRPDAAPIRHMAQQEQRHLDAFDKLIGERRVRPTRRCIRSGMWPAMRSAPPRRCWAARPRWPARSRSRK